MLADEGDPRLRHHGGGAGLRSGGGQSDPRLGGAPKNGDDHDRDECHGEADGDGSWCRFVGISLLVLHLALPRPVDADHRPVGFRFVSDAQR